MSVWCWGVSLHPFEGSGHPAAALFGLPRGAALQTQLGLILAEQIPLSDGCLCGIYSEPLHPPPLSLSHHAVGKTPVAVKPNFIHV